MSPLLQLLLLPQLTLQPTVVVGVGVGVKVDVGVGVKGNVDVGVGAEGVSQLTPVL